MSTPQRLLVGLGNPGCHYFGTRHNIGFQMIETLADSLPSPPRWGRKFKSQSTAVTLAGVPCLLMMPQTFMNLSGESVALACAFYKLAPASVIVVHDDIDLPLGAVRVKQGGGHAGHNGLKSIDSLIGRNYWRVRIGIGRPPAKNLGDNIVSNWVLGHFTAKETAHIHTVCLQIVDALPHLLVNPPDGVRFLRSIARGTLSTS